MNVVGVRFRNAGKIYYFKSQDIELAYKDKVLVESTNGVELAEIALANIDIDKEKFDKDLSSVLRKASLEDLQKDEQNRIDAKEAMLVCQQKVVSRKLDMKIVDSEYNFDRSKITFYFTSENRVDFRNLVKDLALVFKNRIELRQIGVRDHAKMKNYHGACGQKTCCSRFITDFSPLSIKMAKDQGITLDPSKISGVCGRLMCCLSFEQDSYKEIKKLMPKVGQKVQTADGEGLVISNDYLRELIRLRIKDIENDEEIEKEYRISEIS